MVYLDSLAALVTCLDSKIPEVTIHLVTARLPITEKLYDIFLLERLNT